MLVRFAAAQGLVRNAGYRNIPERRARRYRVQLSRLPPKRLFSTSYSLQAKKAQGEPLFFAKFGVGKGTSYRCKKEKRLCCTLLISAGSKILEEDTFDEKVKDPDVFDEDFLEPQYGAFSR